MKKLMRKFEDIMSAAAFAEAGEFESAREMNAGRQKVLVTITGRESDIKSFKYAVSICKRIQAGLEILSVAPEGKAAGLLRQFQAELQGVHYEIVQKTGCLKEAIVDHTNKRGDIQLVIIESSEVLATGCTRNENMFADMWKKLKCPLVVVTDAAAA